MKTKERIHELEDNLPGLMNREKLEKKEEKEEGGVSEAHGTITKEHMFVSLESKQEGARGTETLFEEIMAENPKLGRRHKPTDPRN